MNLRQEELQMMEKDSIYIPFSGIQEEKQLQPEEYKVYAAYSVRMYREYGVWFRMFHQLPLHLLNHAVYFHFSGYIPYLSSAGYRIEAVRGTQLVEFLQAVPDNTYIFISIKDEGSQSITQEAEEQLSAVGINMLDKSKLRHSYIWVAYKKAGHPYEIIHEACEEVELTWNGELAGEQVSILSGGSLASNISSIRIGQDEWSPNMRGLNIVTLRPSTGKIEATAFDTFATLYAQGSLFRAVAMNHSHEHDIFAAIGHAGGQIDGVNYTNCREALELNYRGKGHRVFELDFELTSDGHLVARQDWDSLLYQVLRQRMPEGITPGQPLSIEQFRSMKILERLSPMTITDVFQFLVDHPDAYMVTDTKHIAPSAVRSQFKQLIEAASPFGYEVLLRVIPQLYTESMYGMIEELFPFPRYIYTLYQTSASDEEIIRFVRQRSIYGVALSPERYSDQLTQGLNAIGAKLYMHTINDVRTVRKYVRRGVHGFYTDTLPLTSITKERYGYQIELETRRMLLIEYLALRFEIPEDKSISVINVATMKELLQAEELLFRADNVAVAIDWLKSRAVD